MDAKSRTYRCPECGKTAVLGQHFCIVKPREVEAQPPRRIPFLVSVVVAALLVMALLWESMGVYSVVALALAPAAVALAELLRRLKSRRSSAQYKELLLMVGMDRHAAERLIRAEARRRPGLGRAEAIELALQKLSYDRGR